MTVTVAADAAASANGSLAPVTATSKTSELSVAQARGAQMEPA